MSFFIYIHDRFSTMLEIMEHLIRPFQNFGRLLNAVNDPPVLGEITAPIDPLAVDTAVNVSATFTDPDVGDTHTAEWDWGDNGTTQGTVNQAGGSVTSEYSYDTPGGPPPWGVVLADWPLPQPFPQSLLLRPQAIGRQQVLLTGNSPHSHTRVGRLSGPRWKSGGKWRQG